MALTVTLTQTAGNLAGVFSSIVMKYALITGDASYPAGGYAVTTTTFGFAADIYSLTGTENQVAGGYYLVFDPLYDNVRVYTFPATSTAAMSEVATGTNLSNLSLNTIVAGV